MARAVEQIEQDLAALEEAIALLAKELYAAYSQYLTFLGQAVRRHLILACYQVCTQGYPEAFLGLSFTSREQLQQAVKQLGSQVREQLLAQLEEPKNLIQTPVDSEQAEEPTQDSLPEASEMSDESDAPIEISETAKNTSTSSLKPDRLEQWQEQLEEAIAQTLQAVSLETNRLLRKNGIIPDKLPEAVLEAATKVEASSEATPGSPNLLNLLMETESEEEEDSTLTRIVAIKLRLSEIEFADPTLSAVRTQIRNLSAKGSKLQRDYHKKQRERAVARAEAAWRASWFDD